MGTLYIHTVLKRTAMDIILAAPSVFLEARFFADDLVEERLPAKVSARRETGSPSMASMCAMCARCAGRLTTYLFTPMAECSGTR